MVCGFSAIGIIGITGLATEPTIEGTPRITGIGGRDNGGITPTAPGGGKAGLTTAAYGGG